MSQLIKKQRKTRKHYWIAVNSLSSDSLVIVLSNIKNCLVKKLDIRSTKLDSICVTELSHVLSDNETMKKLQLWSSPFPRKTLQIIINALSINNTLKSLEMCNDYNITEKDICNIISSNGALKLTYLSNCPNIAKFGEQQISNVLVDNNTLMKLFVNGSHLR